MKLSTFLLIVATVLLTAYIIILPASAGSYTQINSNVYDWINGQGNPGKALPNDQTWFHATVTYVERTWETDAKGVKTGKYHDRIQTIGYYDFNQIYTNAFPHIMGDPFSTKVSKSCIFGDMFCWYSTTDGYYHIQPTNTPPGYCPMYPDGENYHKTDTTTVVLKYYRSDSCGKPITDYRHYHGIIVIT